MEEMIAMSIFLLLCYLAIGFGINMILDAAYNIDILLGSMLFWPIIVIFIGILDVVNLIRKLMMRNRK